MNKSIQRLLLDDNGLDVACLRSLEVGLQRNNTIDCIPFPVNDFTVLLSKADVAQRREVAKRRSRLIHLTFFPPRRFRVCGRG